MTKRTFESTHFTLSSYCLGEVALDAYVAARQAEDDRSTDALSLDKWTVEFRDPDGGAELRVAQLFTTDEDCAYLFSVANALPLEHQPPITMWGRQCRMRRDIGFFAAPGIAGYRYGGQMSKSAPLTPELTRLLELVNRVCGATFNGILVNRYNNGSDYISPHSDQESSLAPGVGVVAISCGATRTMDFRRTREPFTQHHFAMRDGSALCMYGARFQKLYTHGIRAVPRAVGTLDAFLRPDARRELETRISLTFRCHVATE